MAKYVNAATHFTHPPGLLETVGCHRWFPSKTLEDESRGTAVLLDEYAVDPEPQRSSSGAPKPRICVWPRPRMPVGNEGLPSGKLT